MAGGGGGNCGGGGGGDWSHREGGVGECHIVGFSG